MYEMLLSNDESDQPAWKIAAEESLRQISEELWGWPTELHLKPKKLWNELLSKSRFFKMSSVLKPSIHKETTQRKHTYPLRNYAA